MRSTPRLGAASSKSRVRDGGTLSTPTAVSGGTAVCSCHLPPRPSAAVVRGEPAVGYSEYSQGHSAYSREFRLHAPLVLSRVAGPAARCGNKQTRLQRNNNRQCTDADVGRVPPTWCALLSQAAKPRGQRAVTMSYGQRPFLSCPVLWQTSYPILSCTMPNVVYPAAVLRSVALRYIARARLCAMNRAERTAG